MKNCRKILSNLMTILVLFYLFSIIGCGMSITSESAQTAVNNAKTTFESAKSSQADAYSKSKMKNAERLLNEAEKSLSRNRWQRAYTLAKRSGETAKSAEMDANQNLKKETIKESPQDNAPPDTAIIPKSPQLSTQYNQPNDFPTNTLTPRATLFPNPLLQQTTLGIQSTAPAQKEISLPELQNQLQSAFKALESAQNALQSARLLIVKIQVDIGLLTMDANIQQIQKAGASLETVNAAQSLYGQVQQSAKSGNYEIALYFLDQINAYVRTLFIPNQ